MPRGRLSARRAAKAKKWEVVIYPWVACRSRMSRDAHLNEVMAQRPWKDMENVASDMERMIQCGFKAAPEM